MPPGTAPSPFASTLASTNRGGGARSWVYVPYDQLNDRIGPLARTPPAAAGIVMVEAPWKAARRPYHKQKLATVLATSRHFAIEQAKRGVQVRYVVSQGSYDDALRDVARELGPLAMMEAAERELRVDVAPLVEEGLLRVEPHTGWLTTQEQFQSFAGARPPWRMDTFYRGVRKATGILMSKSGPTGGRFSFDAENRKPWRGEPAAPNPPVFRVDPVTQEVCDLVSRDYAHHPGTLDPAAIPASQDDAHALWRWALESCLPHFGPYEDAMSRRETGLFHSRISALLNLHRLLPSEVVAEVLAAPIPIASQEGFVRQLLGWREYMRHVHLATDGFRVIPPRRTAPGEARRPERRAVAGDGGYAGWAGKAWSSQAPAIGDGGAAPSALGAHRPLPPAYWGTASGLACLDVVVDGVWREAYSHHITRLMILSNIAQLLDVEPRELTDWFWVAYADAYDWVVEPNVLAMSTYGLADIATTKPYVSGAAYIHRMSDYCSGCAFDPKSTCPLTRMYWAYLARHSEALVTNPRIGQPLRAAAKRDAEERRRDAEVFEAVSEALRNGSRLTPESLGLGVTRPARQ